MKTQSSLFFFFCLISQLHCQMFRCHNNHELQSELHGEYILNSFFCDGDDDCTDGEDENLGCSLKHEGNHTCDKKDFVCDGNQCKNITVRCNTIKDCLDGTDEQNCGDEINVKNCTSEDKFLCHDRLRCLGLEYTCDSRCNCFDCSDENENCSKDDHDLKAKCPEAYLVTANGPKCFCDLNGKTKGLCDSIRKCSKSWFCQQRCTKFKHRRICSCFAGFYVYNDTCKPKDDFETMMIYSNDHEIISLNETSRGTTPISKEISNCTLLTAANNYLYCAKLSARNKGNVFKMSLKSKKPILVIETDSAITSIAVDYITNNIYFTSDGSLSVCSKNGEICTQLKCCGVQYMALAPKIGWMFYTQTQPEHCQNGSVLTRSNMDGSGEIVIPDLYLGKISFVVDESQKAIHLLETILKKGEHTAIFNKISFDEEFQNTKSSSNLGHIQTFGIYNDKIFLKSDKQEMEGIFYIVKANMMYSSPIFEYAADEYYDSDFFKFYSDDNSTSKITSMYVYNAAVQRSSENPCEKSPCTGLCLVRPSTLFSNYSMNYTCVCDGSTQRGHNLWCWSDSAHTDRDISVWVVICISLGIIMVFAGIGYCMFKKQICYDYYLTVGQFCWQIGESSDQRMPISDQEE